MPSMLSEPSEYSPLCFLPRGCSCETCGGRCAILNRLRATLGTRPHACHACRKTGPSVITPFLIFSSVPPSTRLLMLMRVAAGRCDSAIFRDSGHALASARRLCSLNQSLQSIQMQMQKSDAAHAVPSVERLTCQVACLPVRSPVRLKSCDARLTPS